MISGLAGELVSRCTVQGVNELSSHFEKYKGVPKIAELNAEVQTARDALIQLVNHEFTQERSQVRICSICVLVNVIVRVRA